MMASIQYWSVTDVEKWLKTNGFSDYVDLLCEKHAINGCALLMLQEDDLRNPPCEIKTLGDRKRLLMCIHKLRMENPAVQNQYFRGDHEKRGGGPSPAKRLDSECSAFSEDMDEKGLEAKHLKPEYTKLIVSYVYMFSVFLVTAMVMVIVHDRVPDMKKYPPLPDIVLDNMPYVPWAFEMCELTGLVLFIVWFIVLFFHKHRSV